MSPSDYLLFAFFFVVLLIREFDVMSIANVTIVLTIWKLKFWPAQFEGLKSSIDRKRAS